MLCATVQCHGNGSGSGRCGLCQHGYLPNWSRSTDARTCGRKGCDGMAVSVAPRVRQVCVEHAKTTKLRMGGRTLTLVEYAAERIALRDSGGTGAVWMRWQFAS